MPDETSTSRFSNAIDDAIYGSSAQQQQEEAKKQEEEAKKQQAEKEGK
jgi:hypothetical protein